MGTSSRETISVPFAANTNLPICPVTLIWSRKICYIRGVARSLSTLLCTEKNKNDLNVAHYFRVVILVMMYISGMDSR